MADIAFIQFTGETLRRQSARIPRTEWEERKPQIINLYGNHTLDEVVGIMAEAGFTANRRQYVYQLDQWGVTKYNVTHAVTSDSNGVLCRKRKHSVAGADHDDDHRITPSSQAKSHKIPKVADRGTVGADNEAKDQQGATDKHQRSGPDLEETIDATDSGDSQPVTQPPTLTPGSSKTTVGDFCELLCSSKSNWYTGRGNLTIAHEVALFATKVRSQPHEDVLHDYLPANYQFYLQDIGEYLWGTHEGEKAYDIYALMLESSSHSPLYRSVHMETLLSCARSANSCQACQWLASFLQKTNGALKPPSGTWDASVLICLILASKLSRYDSQESGKQHARDALQLRGGSDHFPTWCNILHSVQDQYSLEIGKVYDLGAEASAKRLECHQEGVMKSLRLDRDMFSLKMHLLSLCEIITAEGLEKIISRELGEGEENDDGSIPYSVILFKFLWGTQFEHPQTHRPWWSTWQMSSACSTPPPDFLGACCDLFEHLIIEQTKTSLARTDNPADVDLVAIVSLADAVELYADLVKAYYYRDLGSYSGSLAELRDCIAKAASKNVIIVTGSWVQPYPEADPTRASYQGMIAALRRNRLAGGSRGSLPPDMDPTWASSRGSSGTSYQGMLEARSAMRRNRLAGGSHCSLPSAAMDVDELGTSMRSLSVDYM